MCIHMPVASYAADHISACDAHRCLPWTKGESLAVRCYVHSQVWCEVRGSPYRCGHRPCWRRVIYPGVRSAISCRAASTVLFRRSAYSVQRSRDCTSSRSDLSLVLAPVLVLLFVCIILASLLVYTRQVCHPHQLCPGTPSCLQTAIVPAKFTLLVLCCISPTGILCCTSRHSAASLEATHLCLAYGVLLTMHLCIECAQDCA